MPQKTKAVSHLSRQAYAIAVKAEPIRNGGLCRTHSLTPVPLWYAHNIYNPPLIPQEKHAPL